MASIHETGRFVKFIVLGSISREFVKGEYPPTEATKDEMEME
jgi:hypothetical protein